MVECQFVEGLGNFVEPDAWERLIDPEHKPLAPTFSVPVFVGLDLALSPKGDDCALIGVYRRPDGRAALAFHQVWKGGGLRIRRLKLGDTVKPFILDLRQRYNLAGVYFDPWQAQLLADELRSEGVNCVAVPQTRSTRAPKDTRLWEMVTNRELVLYDDPDVRNMAAGANAQELGDGRLFLKKASGRSKIDLLVALSNCADEAIAGLPQAMSAPSPYDPLVPREPETARERSAAAHDPSNPAHVRYAQRHFCAECHLAWLAETGQDPEPVTFSW